MNVRWIGIAGMVGTLLRYGLGGWMERWFPQSFFPVGTWTVNMIGCFALGWFSEWAMDKTGISPAIRTAVSTGLIGSFTTFSTVSVETVQLFRQGLYGIGGLYAGTSLIGGLCLAWMGTAIAGRRRGKGSNG
ncbi:fluoride efflux transporter CrcB [Staphylospora marina]|uniref:fluoride efflux transporter CrcB n=1 Tax=Staphylospora marina TaxID=2490858 RepID=UPI000F5B953C|nr:fluoride efflux transporter CrcB [Staphylospora marina]